MTALLHLQKLNWLTGGVHALILSGAAHANTAAAWPVAFGAMSVVSFAAWIGNYRRLRHIADTPLSNIATAAQGYVEIAGIAEMPGGTPIVSKLSLTPCVWYEYEVHEKNSKGEWTLRDSGASDDPFIIDDAAAKCVIDPEGAEIICLRERTWTQGSERYTEWLLLPHERVYALGEFATVGGADTELDLAADVGALLAEWKKDQPELLRRFDADRSGTIDLREWELARRTAVLDVQARHREIRASAGTNVLRAPADGRLFLLSNELPAALRSRFLRWAWAHAVVFIAAGGAAFGLA
jgi:hypothetical protein